MTDAFIIDLLIKEERRKREQRREQERPRLELPLYREPPEPYDQEEDKEDGKRGVIIIDL